MSNKMSKAGIKNYLAKLSGTKYGKFLMKFFFKEKEWLLTDVYDIMQNNIEQLRNIQFLNYLGFVTGTEYYLCLKIAKEFCRAEGLNTEYTKMSELSKLTAFISPEVSKTYKTVKLYDETGYEDIDIEDLLE